MLIAETSEKSAIQVEHIRRGGGVRDRMDISKGEEMGNGRE